MEGGGGAVGLRGERGSLEIRNLDSSFFCPSDEVGKMGGLAGAMWTWGERGERTIILIAAAQFQGLCGYNNFRAVL